MLVSDLVEELLKYPQDLDLYKAFRDVDKGTIDYGLCNIKLSCEHINRANFYSGLQWSITKDTTQKQVVILD